MNCPICDEPMRSRSYKDDVHGAMVTVEEHTFCPRGHYAFNWAYGSGQVEVNGNTFLPSDEVGIEAAIRATKTGRPGLDEVGRDIAGWDEQAERLVAEQDWEAASICKSKAAELRRGAWVAGQRASLAADRRLRITNPSRDDLEHPGSCADLFVVLLFVAAIAGAIADRLLVALPSPPVASPEADADARS